MTSCHSKHEITTNTTDLHKRNLDKMENKRKHKRALIEKKKLIKNNMSYCVEFPSHGDKFMLLFESTQTSSSTT